jgi:hypothetical protein
VSSNGFFKSYRIAAVLGPYRSCFTVSYSVSYRRTAYCPTPSRSDENLLKQGYWLRPFESEVTPRRVGPECASPYVPIALCCACGYVSGEQPKGFCCKTGKLHLGNCCPPVAVHEHPARRDAATAPLVLLYYIPVFFSSPSPFTLRAVSCSRCHVMPPAGAAHSCSPPLLLGDSAKQTRLNNG